MTPEPGAALDTLLTHLDWADGAYVAFVFAERPGDARALAQRAAEHLREHGRTLARIAPRTAEALRGAVPRLLAGGPDADTLWLDAPWFDTAGAWRAAWIWVLERLNERREQLLAACPGGVVFALHTRDKAEARRIAPDLWSIHALSLTPKRAPAIEWIVTPDPAAPDDPCRLAIAGVGPIELPTSAPCADDVAGALAERRVWPSPTNESDTGRLAARLDAWRADVTDALTALADPPASRLAIDLPWRHPAAGAPWAWLPTAGGPIRRVHRRLPGAPRSAPRLPLRVLLVLPDAADLRAADPHSGAEALLDGLDALAGAAQVEALRPATLGALTDRLRAEAVDVLYVHGLLRQRSGVCQLALEADAPDAREAGDVRWAPLARIAGVLGEASPSLVVLDAAFDPLRPWTPEALGLGAFDGVAGELLLPPSLPSGECRSFWRAFWEAVASGEDVGDAVAAGRRALSELDRGLLLFGQRGVDRPLAPPGLRAPPRRPPPTHTLPGPPAVGFVGRGAERARIDRALDAGLPVGIVGPAGQGKTALAVAIARWAVRCGRFPGGAVFVRWAADATPDDIVGQIADGLEPDGDSRGIDAIRARLQRAATLLVFDRADGAEDDETAECIATLSRVGGTRAITTVRRRALASHLSALLLSGLTAVESRVLFRRHAAARGLTLPDLGGADRATLVDYVGGHPLGLEVVCAALQRASVDELLDDMLSGRPDLLAIDDAAAIALRRGIDESVSRLTDEERSTLRPLAALARGVGVEILRPLLGLARDAWVSTVGLLRDEGLAVMAEAGRYLMFHPLLAATLAAGQPDEALADHRARRAAVYRAWLVEDSGLRAASVDPLVREELSNLLVVPAELKAYVGVDASLACCDALRDALRPLGDPRVLARIDAADSRLAGDFEPEVDQDPALVLSEWVEDARGRLREGSAHPDAALAALAEAEAIWRALGHAAELGGVLLQKGVALMRLGERDAAADALRDAFGLGRGVDQPALVADAAGALAELASIEERWDAAETWLRRQVEAAERAGDDGRIRRARAALSDLRAGRE